MHSGLGKKIGPDLTGMAVHPKAHLLVDILNPSFNVEENYRTYVAATTDGRIISGLLSAEGRTSIELLDAEDKRHPLLREDIDELQRTRKSLMPDGFEKQVTQTDLLNLLEFLTQRGKYLPLPLAKAATVVTTRGMFYAADGSERMIFDDWSPKTFHDVPFALVDPQEGRVPNAVLLYGPIGNVAPHMPRQVSLSCNTAAKAIHLLGCVSGWGARAPVANGSVSMIVRLHYQDGQTEDHPLRNGEHLSDYISRFEVPGSEFAFGLQGGKQLRYLAIVPGRTEVIQEIELAKGPDSTAPIVMAITAETFQ